MTWPSLTDFADDIWLLDDDLNTAQDLLSSVIVAVAKMVLIINARKTQAVFSNHAPENLKCEKGVLEKGSHFNYLGSTITYNNDITKEIEKRIAKATIKSKRLLEVKQHLHKLKGEALPNVRAKYPVVREWELEPKKNQTKATDVFENKCARWFLSQILHVAELIHLYLWQTWPINGHCHPE